MKKRIMQIFGMKAKAIRPPIYRDVEWTEGDKVCLKNFLESSTGTKLLVLMTNEQALKNAEACGVGIGDREWRAGIAFGVGNIRSKILWLRAPDKKEPDENEEEFSQKEIDEKLKEMSAQGGRKP